MSDQDFSTLPTSSDQILAVLAAQGAASHNPDPSARFYGGGGKGCPNLNKGRACEKSVFTQ